MTEIWKSVNGYEGLYEVSNFGRVRSLDRTTRQYNNGTLSTARYRGKLLKGRTDDNGYVRVHISKCGKSEALSVHRIVAMAFCEKPEGCDIVNHLDNNPSNNSAENLEWTTYEGNMQWAARQGRMKGNLDNIQKAQESRKVPVIAISPDGEEMYFSSQINAAKQLGIQSEHIAAACRKEYGYKRVGGYEWIYADKERQQLAIPQKIGKTKEELRRLQSKRMKGNALMVGRHLSEKTKGKLSESNGRKVIQYSPDGELVAEYVSANKATKETGITHICDVACGKRKSAGGYLWKWGEVI